MKRKSPCVPPVNKGTVRQGCATYRALTYIKETGSATSRDVHIQAMRDKSAQQVRDVLAELVRAGHLFRVGRVRVVGVRSMVLYSADPGGLIKPVPPLSQVERQRAYVERKQVKVASVFEFRGTLSIEKGSV